MAEKSKYIKATTPSTVQISPNEYGKMPPQAPELEEAVLGALMIEKDAYFQVSEILKPEYFYKPLIKKFLKPLLH